MHTLQKEDVIENQSSAYIINGGWTHYFQRDAVTNDLLALICPPTGWEVAKLEDGTTYDDLHHHNNIDIAANDPIRHDTTYLPDNTTNVVALFADTLYTDGHRLLTTDDATYVVLDPKSFTQCAIPMTNDITQESISVVISDLYSLNTPKMRQTLYHLASNGTPEEQSYMRISMKYDKTIKKLTDAGELLMALNAESDDPFVSLFERTLKEDDHSKNGTLNVPGDYFVDGSDIQYFISLTPDQSHVEFKTMLNSHGELSLRDTVTRPLSHVKTAIERMWIKNAPNPRHELIDVLHRMTYHKLWDISKDLTEHTYTTLWTVSRYYYYNNEAGK